MIIKTELFEGKAYLLDETGNVWMVQTTYAAHRVEIQLVTNLSMNAVKSMMTPQLAKLNPS